MCDTHWCECGDRLIHQSKRGPDESSSAFGQWVHDKLTDEMFTPDIDTVVYKLRTKVLRIIEHKRRGKKLSKSQEAVLPLLAKAVQILASTGLVHAESGVFMVQSDPPYGSARVTQIQGWVGRTDLVCTELSGKQWRSFMEGEVLDLGDSSVEAGAARCPGSG